MARAEGIRPPRRHAGAALQALALGLIALAWAAGCAHAGRRWGVRVTGTIQLASAPRATDCSLDLRREGDDSMVATRPLLGDRFEERLLVPPVPDRYYFVLQCTGAAGEYRSGPFTVEGTEHEATPIELGRIFL